MNPAEALKGINAAKITSEQENFLEENLGTEAYSMDFQIIRVSWTLCYNIPEEYKGGRCIQGHMNDASGAEAEIMFPKARNQEVAKLSRGDKVHLHIKYNHFDKLFSRACFLDDASILIPESELVVTDPGPLHYYLANLLAIVYADGHLCPQEDMVLNKVLARLGANIDDLDTAYALFAEEGYDCKVVGTYSQQIQNMEDMMRLCLADGELHENEKQWITHFSGMLGLDQLAVDKLYQNLDNGF